MTKKKNILFYSASLGGGGAQRQMVNIIDKLEKEKYIITIFVLYNDTRFINEYLFDHKIIVFNDNRLKKLFRLEVLFELINLFNIVKKRKIDIIYARGYTFCWRAAVIKRIFTRSVKLISVESNHLSQIIDTKSSFVKLLLRKLSRFALLNSDLVYCLTKANKDDLVSTLKIPEEIVKIFPVVFDIEQFENIEAKDAGFNSKSFNVICMGRFVRQKNHLFLIDAFGRLKKHDCELHIFGEGEMEHDYVKRVEQLSLTGKVVIHNFTSSPYSVLRQSNLVVFPSLFEGFGNVLLESILCETPIISTNFHGIDERIKKLLAEAGLVVELGDVDGLASKIIYVMGNYNKVKQNIVKIKREIVEEYSLNKYMKLFEGYMDAF